MFRKYYRIYVNNNTEVKIKLTSLGFWKENKLLRVTLVKLKDIVFNPFSTNVPLLYPLKISENLRFSVFRGYRYGTLVENGLKILKPCFWNIETLLRKKDLFNPISVIGLNEFFETTFLPLSWRRFLSYRNQYINLICKLIDWFLHYRELRHERVNIKNLSHLKFHFSWPYVLCRN